MGKEEEEVCLRALQEGRAVYGEWKAQLYPDFNKVGVFRVGLVGVYLFWGFGGGVLGVYLCWGLGGGVWGRRRVVMPSM